MAILSLVVALWMIWLFIEAITGGSPFIAFTFAILAVVNAYFAFINF